MTGSISEKMSALDTASTTATSTALDAVASGGVANHTGGGPLMVVPAGFVANILSGLSGTVGEITGGWFGNAQLGKKIGDAAAPLVELLPFQVIAPEVAPASAGPAESHPGSDEALIVVPAGFLGGLLGGIGGGLLGGTVGKWFGSEDTGSTIGKTAGGVLGGLLPFQVVPPEVMPQSAGPAAEQAPDEPMVVVPAGFFGNLIGGFAGTVGGLVGGSTGKKIGDAASPFIKLLPFQAVPPDMAPASAGPAGGGGGEEMIVVPAGFFGSLLSGMAGTIGSTIDKTFGGSGKTGGAIGSAAAPILDLLPFHAVPPELAPASAGPGGETAPQDKLIFVPAGLFGSLLSGLAGTVGGIAGVWFGDAKTGQAVGDAVAPVLDLLPFHTVAPAAAH